MRFGWDVSFSNGEPINFIFSKFLVASAVSRPVLNCRWADAVGAAEGAAFVVVVAEAAVEATVAVGAVTATVTARVIVVTVQGLLEFLH